MLVCGGWLVVRNAGDLQAAVSDLGTTVIVVSFALGVLGTVAIGQVWLVLLRGLGVHAWQVEAGSVFFVSQLGKYLPGSVWPVMAQMEFGRRWGTPRRTMLTANILMLAMVTATGLVVGVALLPWSSSDGLSRYWWTPLVLLPLLVALRPRTIPAVVDKTLSLFGREPLSVRPTGRSMVVATLWGFVVWVLTGLHLLVMMHAYLHRDVSASGRVVSV